MMTGIAVVLFNRYCVRLSDDVAILRQYLAKSVPVISIEDAVLQVFHFVIESFECCSITTTDNPGHSSPCATIHGFDDPSFVFFAPMKCHISSNSISLILNAQKN